MFEWIIDPTAWLGLLTLIFLELVLGIDNLIFIAVLADKLPAHRREQARIIGLSLALVMRLLLLAAFSWLMALQKPIVSIFGFSLSAREIILILGGIFLIYKATSELHEHVLPIRHRLNGTQGIASSTLLVILQIVVIDAVFSIDSIVMAVGMVDYVSIMMIAVSIAMLLMLFASKMLTHFVSGQPSIILLCLAFLLMIGFSLLCEGVGIAIPKGYLYGAIGFSIMIEILQSIRRRQLPLLETNWRGSHRSRITESIMRLIGGREMGVSTSESHLFNAATPSAVFDPHERRMLQGVLTLADKPIAAVMTMRRFIESIDLDAPLNDQYEFLVNSRHSCLVAVRGGSIDEPLGVIFKNQLMNPLLAGERPHLENYITQPLVLLENVSVSDALEQYRHKTQKIAFIVNEFGTLEGIATIADILQEIAGDLPEPGEIIEPVVISTADNTFIADASEDIHDINQYLPQPLPIGRKYHTLAGLVVDKLEFLPYVGALTQVENWRLEVLAVEHYRITKVKLILMAPVTLNLNDAVNI